MTLGMLRWLIEQGVYSDDLVSLEWCRLGFARWLVERGMLSDWGCE